MQFGKLQSYQNGNFCAQITGVTDLVTMILEYLVKLKSMKECFHWQSLTMRIMFVAKIFVKSGRSKNLSQADLARKAQLEGLNVDKKTISLIENGKRGFQDYEILCFARALGVPASYILEGIPEA